MNWGSCCRFEKGDVVKHNGATWLAIRDIAKGEVPGISDGWVKAERRVAMARTVDPRIGEGK